MNNFVLLKRTSFCLVYMTHNGLGFLLASAETYTLQTLAGFYFSEKILSISKGQLYNIFKVSMQMATLAHHHC